MVTQSNNIMPKVIAAMIAQDCPQPYHLSSQLPFPISHVNPMCCHANITGCHHFIGPLICCHRNFTWRSLCLTGECLRCISQQDLLTRISSFRLFNQATNSLWMCIETSCVLGMLAFVMSGFIVVKQFWKVKSSAVAKGCKIWAIIEVVSLCLVTWAVITINWAMRCRTFSCLNFSGVPAFFENILSSFCCFPPSSASHWHTICHGTAWWCTSILFSSHSFWYTS